MNMNKLFENNNKEIGLLYIIKKISETPIKNERVKLYKETLIYFQNKEDTRVKELNSMTAHNVTCQICGDVVDPDTNLCLNCNAPN